VWISRDGVRWNQVLSSRGGAGGVDVVDGGAGTLLAYWVRLAWFTHDPKVWGDPSAPSLPEPLSLQSVAPGAQLGIGIDFNHREAPTPLLRSHDGGHAWTTASDFLRRFPEARAWTITRASGLWVAAGWSGQPNHPDAWVSTDGASWESLPPALYGGPGGMLSVVSEIAGRVVLMGSAPELDRYYVRDATATPQRSFPDASTVAALCPYPTPLERMSADGLPNIAGAVVDPRRAQAVLARNAAALRIRYPKLTRVEVGPGFGRAWTGQNGGAYSVVAIRDYGILVHLRGRADCPVGSRLFASVEGIPLFFASP
jgi:hypothetical protein